MTRKHLLKRLGHPLGCASVNPVFLLDLGQRDALILGGGRFGEAQVISGFLKDMAPRRSCDSFCHPYALN